MTVDERPAAGAAPPPLDLPVRSRPARAIVLAVVFVCAACGLVYELALVALGSYLLGNTVTQASVVLALMVAGALIPGWGWVLLALVTLFLAWLLVLGWPRLSSQERLMRVAVVALALAITITQAFPR